MLSWSLNTFHHLQFSQVKKLTVLESLRGFASIYVAIGHFILSHKNIPVSLGFLFRFGQEAVIIFFILSGFVIFYSSSKNQNESLYSYFIKRFRRIYFPLICALIVSIVFVSCDFPIKALVGNLLMLQDFETGKPGSFVAPFFRQCASMVSFIWMDILSLVSFYLSGNRKDG